MVKDKMVKDKTIKDIIKEFENNIKEYFKNEGRLWSYTTKFKIGENLIINGEKMYIEDSNRNYNESNTIYKIELKNENNNTKRIWYLKINDLGYGLLNRIFGIELYNRLFLKNNPLNYFIDLDFEKGYSLVFRESVEGKHPLMDLGLEKSREIIQKNKENFFKSLVKLNLVYYYLGMGDWSFKGVGRDKNIILKPHTSEIELIDYEILESPTVEDTKNVYWDIKNVYEILKKFGITKEYTNKKIIKEFIEINNDVKYNLINEKEKIEKIKNIFDMVDEKIIELDPEINSCKSVINNLYDIITSKNIYDILNNILNHKLKILEEDSVKKYLIKDILLKVLKNGKRI